MPLSCFWLQIYLESLVRIDVENSSPEFIIYKSNTSGGITYHGNKLKIESLLVKKINKAREQPTVLIAPPPPLGPFILLMERIKEWSSAAQILIDLHTNKHIIAQVNITAILT